MNRSLNLGRIWITVILLFAPSFAYSENNEVNVDESGIAIHGYDPVAYFVSGKPVQGQADYEYKWSGATWRFSSEANRRRFIDDPKKYAPQYGGFCAYAASYGQFADTDPQEWSVVNDKLYLNYSPGVRETWRPRAEEFIGDADQLWPTMKKEEDEP